jgi:hypothetical protein
VGVTSEAETKLQIYAAIVCRAATPETASAEAYAARGKIS